MAARRATVDGSMRAGATLPAAAPAVVRRLATVHRDVPTDTVRLAARLAAALAEAPQGAIGLCGAQGSGKSTLARVLPAALAQQGRRMDVLALDDFYLPLAARRRLALRVHPLLVTRGVPGTHDVERLANVIAALAAGGGARIPVFDKGLDDRQPARCDRRIPPGADLVLLEGWCVGVPAQPDAALTRPVNALERAQDPQCTWRHWVNGMLREAYEPIWSGLTGLGWLRAPDLAAVARWRGWQERQRPAALRMRASALRRFIAHYERLTLHADRMLPERADLIVTLRADHRTARVQRGPFTEGSDGRGHSA